MMLSIKLDAAVQLQQVVSLRVLGDYRGVSEGFSYLSDRNWQVEALKTITYIALKMYSYLLNVFHICHVPIAIFNILFQIKVQVLKTTFLSK